MAISIFTMIDDSVVSGTAHLVDLDHNMSTKHSEGNKEIVLIPTRPKTLMIRWIGRHEEKRFQLSV